MINGKKIIVVMPAYNAEKTLETTYKEIPMDIVDEVILTDDLSQDNTIEEAKKLGIKEIHIHKQNKGYGGNQKTCYNRALELGADIVIMVHPDYQYTPKLIHSMAHRILTLIQNIMLNKKLSEYHTGYRAFSAEVLRNIAYMKNSDDFIFDNEMLAQIFYAGYDIGEVTCPTKYFEDASSINMKRSMIYGLGVLRVSLVYRLCKWGLMKSKLFSIR
jgi:glycosyltransferase involved in cell wall biosynthesis